MADFVVASIRIKTHGIHFVFDPLDESAVKAVELLSEHASKNDVRADVLRELSISGAITDEDAELLVPVISEWQTELGLEEFVVAPTKLITVATGGPSTYIALVSVMGETEVEEDGEYVEDEEDGQDGERWV